MKHSKTPDLETENLRFAKRFISRRLTPVLVEQLRDLTSRFSLSLRCGDLLLLNGGWYVTHAGLIRLAERSRCSGMHVHQVRHLSDPSTSRYAFRATVYKSSRCRGFVGFGDADPSNVSFLVHGAEIARCRDSRRQSRSAKSLRHRHLFSRRDWIPHRAVATFPRVRRNSQPQPANGNYGGPTVRDRLCQLIRMHQLDATLVKSYATDFCGVKSLRQATREQVENFVTHLADCAEKDRNALPASSTAISARKKVQRETPDCRPPRCRSLCVRPTS